MWLRVAIFAAVLTCVASRLCCTQNFLLNANTKQCEPPDSLTYTSLFFKESTPAYPPNCSIPNNGCFSHFNNSVAKVDCNLTKVVNESVPRLRVCCPHGHVFSSRIHACLPHNSSSAMSQVLWDITPEKFLLLDHGPLEDCLLDNAIVDTPVHKDMIVLDESFSGFYVKGHPELSGDKCLALHDGDESFLVVRTCLPKEQACTSERVCLRRCCSDGMAYYDNVKQCRDKWVPLPVDAHKRSYFSPSIPIKPKPFGYAMMHGINCKKYPLHKNISEEQWTLLNDGTLLRDGKYLISYDKFCVDNLDLETFVGIFAFICSAEPPLMDTVKGSAFIVSCFFLTITIIVYLIVPRLHNLHGKTLICYAFWMLLVYIAFSIMYFVHVAPIYCVFLGYFGYFSFFSASSWMNIMSFDIWWTLGGSLRTRTNVAGNKRKKENHRFGVYAIYAAIVASVLTSICVFIQFSPDLVSQEFSPNMATDICFLSDKYHGKIIYFLIPLSLMLSANIVFFILTVRNFLKIRNDIERLQDTTKEGKRRKLSNDMSKFATNGKLFVVMGILWIFEVISVKLGPNSWVWHVPDMVNALHGLLIFIIYVLKRSVLNELQPGSKPGINQRKDMINSSARSMSTSITKFERV